MLKDTDPTLFTIIQSEVQRQEQGLEMIASENYCSLDVMEAQGSVLTNKYAEGYPGKRYYGGCEHIDRAEQLAIDRAKELFGVEYVNVQPHSGAQANMAVYFTVLNPGDKVMGMDLSQGGHLTHGSPANFSGKLYQFVSYGVDLQTEQIDYNQVEALALKEKPKLIIAGASAYPRQIDFEIMGQIAKKCGAYLHVDMAHIAGLVATGLHPNPVGHADFITSTTQKTLRGPRGGIILSSNEWSKKLNSAVFPGMQGSPMEHVIAAKAVAFKEALETSFKAYQQQVINNAQTLASELKEADISLVSGGTDNHLILVKTGSVGLSGKDAEGLLDSVHITCNKNMIPQDTRSPFVTSGIRLGTPALTTRGFKENEIKQVAQWIVQVLRNPENPEVHQQIKKNVLELCQRHPVYPGLL